MALGKTTRIDNADAAFGAEPHYWFVKVQATYGAEEYWMLTDAELAKFTARADDNPEDVLELPRRGLFVVAENAEPRFGAAAEYYGVRIDHITSHTAWLLTDHDLERIRQRVEANAEDVKANQEGWLSDLLD